VVLICELTVIGGWALQQLSEGSWWPAIAAALVPPMAWLIPAAIAVGAALAARDGFAIIASVVLIPVVLFGLMGLQWQPGDANISDDTFVIVSWNIHNQHQHGARVRRVIDSTGADVCLLQEAVDNRFLRHLSDWQCAHEQSQRLCVTHPAAGNWQLSPARALPVDGSFRNALWATAQIDDTPVDILNVHLSPGDKSSVGAPVPPMPQRLWWSHGNRRRQIAAVAQWARETDGPFIIGGDFNTPPAEQILAPLRAVASDAFAQAGRGLGYTFPRTFPVYRIDGIWVSEHFRVVGAGVVDGGMSDHELVWAELQLAP
jgi:vancomycin resistance protein VanJ